jgi:hypothetical protein
MARTTRGTKRQAESRTALFAYVAAKLAGLPTRLFDDTFKRWGLAVRQDSALRAASPAKSHPATKLRPGRTARSATPARAASGSFREWLLVDELRLDLEVALIRFPGGGSRQDELLEGLATTAGVRQVVETARVRDVYAFVVFEGAQRRRELRARLEELAHALEWDDILFETHEPSIEMWRDLAYRAAEAEDLLDS